MRGMTFVAVMMLCVSAFADAGLGPVRAKLTPEQIAERKAKREKFFADRKAKIEAQILEVLKKHGVEGETAQAIVKDLAETMSNPFMGMGARARKPRPAKAEKPATK